MNIVTSYLLTISIVLLGSSPCFSTPRTHPVQPVDGFCQEPLDLQFSGSCNDMHGFASDTIPSDSVVFRVQIITSLNENSFPTVFIEGEMYQTYEYFYMGSYRITVGKFNTLKEAQEFRLKCLNSGFKQAFVAAFRGDTRITDPSVFKE